MENQDVKITYVLKIMLKAFSKVFVKKYMPNSLLRET